MIKYVGFDKDGTLIDSSRAIAKEWGKIINHDYGVDPNEAEQIFSVTAAGQPTDLQLELTLEGHGFSFSKEELFEKASKIAIRLGKNVKAEPFPEAIVVLKELKEKKYNTFLSSSHQETVVKEDLERTGLLEYIDYFVGARPSQPSFKKREPHFRNVSKHFNVPFDEFIKKTVFVGDTPPDIKAANDCNIISVARLGSVPKEKLLEAGARFIIKDLTELPRILSSLG